MSVKIGVLNVQRCKGLLQKYKSFSLEGEHNDCPLDGSWLEGVCYVLDKI